MADNPRQDLYLEISRSLVHGELTDLRNYVSGAKILPAGVIQNANAHQIFNQLEKENKLTPGDLTLLADLLRKIGRHDYAEQAEKIAENERKELRKHDVPTKRPREKGMDYKAGQMKKMRGEEDKETVSKSRTPSQHDSDVMDTEADEQTSRLTSALTANYRNTLGHLMPLPWEGRFVLDLDMVFTRPELVGHGGVTLQSLDDVFDYLSVPARGMSKRFNVLVVGDAGSGKSTLFSKTAFDWSCKKGKLADMNKIVLLIRLRKVKPGESIAEIVWDQCVSQSAKGISIPSIETCLRDYESDMVFLLDGYDELVSDAKEPKQAVPELLAKTRCPNCTVIVTSRPFSGIERYMQIDHKVNFMGFSAANVDAFVRLYFQSVGKPDLADSLVKALDSRAIIVDRGLIQTPMFLMLICVLWEENPTLHQFPVTMSGLHQELLTCVIRKYCVREGLPMSNDEIPPVVSAALLHLGKLALEALLRGESLVDIGKTTTNQDTDVMVNLGIVSKEVSASRLHPREQLNFPHKSMQEFLAARYVADRVNTSSDDLHSLVPLDTVSTFVDQTNLVQFIYDFGGQVASDLLQAGAVVKTDSASVPIEVGIGGPELRALYDRACEEGYTEVYSTRFVLIGKFGNGKSNLCNSLLGEEFDPEWKITDGIAIHPCVMTQEQQWRKLEGQEDHYPHTVAQVMKKLKDEKEEETDPKSPTKNDRPDSDAMATSTTELEAVTTMSSVFKNKGEERAKPDFDSSDTTGPDVQATTPLLPASDAQVDKTPPKTFLKAADIFRKQRESDDQSNVTGTKEYPLISIWDFGGQEIFYSTQQVFYTHRAIYGMVLDLTKPLDSPVEEMSTVGPTSHCRKEKDFIDYHLESMRAHTRPPVPHRETEAATDIEPPVLVIFTKKDQVPQRGKQQKFHRDTRRHLKGKVIDEHVIDRYFSVDNTKRNPEDKEVTELRKFILDLARKQSYMGERVPVKWLELKSRLQEKHKQGKRYCTLQEVMKAIGSPPRETTPEENAVSILKFWHLCGDIIYFPGQNLRNFVILDPQWFVDVCKTIITIPEYRDREVKKDWDKLQETGELRDHLIEHVWSHREEALQYKLIEHKQELLDMMEKFDLVLRCHGRSDEESGPKCDATEEATYFIPSLLTTVTDERKLYPPGTTCSKPIFIVFDGQFCPVGLYHRLVILTMRRYFNVKPLAYASCARFITDNRKQTFVITKDRFFLKIELLSSVNDDANPFNHGPSVRKGLEEDLRAIIDTWAPGIKYKWCLKCSCEGHKEKEDVESFLPIEDASATEHFASGEVVCETYAPATTTVQDVGLADWFRNPLPQVGDEELSAHPAGQPSVLQDCFHMVVKEVCPQWRELGFRLNLSSANVDEIEERHRGDPRKCCRAVCDRWVQLNGSSATVDVLKDALISIREVPTAEHIDDYLQQMANRQPTQIQLQTGEGRGSAYSCFAVIVEDVCPRWTELSRHLGLTEAQVDEVTEKHSGDPRECCWEALRLWSRINGRNASKERLRAALVSAEEIATAEKLDTLTQ